MPRKVFYSFHYKPDCWRVSQVRNMGAVEGSALLSDNDWEQVKRGGDDGIKRWIAEQMKGRACAVVLVGADTATRKWVRYEIERCWNAGMGVLGVRIHNLKNRDGEQSTAGDNPFASFKVDDTPLSSIVKLYNPPFASSTYVYDHIKANIADWVEEAIRIRSKY